MENEELLIACRDGTIIVVQHHHDWRYSVARKREWGADHYKAGSCFLSCRRAAVSYADEVCGGVAWECRIS